ncbi:MAG TPA: hypothetical protein ENF73_05425 [Proteobacteria bacterium]|nr:hypothetical protein [Pseudomonadota bacterium]
MTGTSDGSAERIGTSLRIYVVGTGIVRAFGLIRSIGFARLLGPDEFGLFILCYGLVAVLEPFATIGLSASLLRFSSSPREARAMLKSGLAASVGITAALLLASPYLGELLRIGNRFVLVLSIASLVPYGFYHLLYCSYQGLRSFLKAVFVQLTYVCVFTLGGMLALWLVSSTAAAAIVSHMAGCALAALFVIPLLSRGDSVQRPSFAIKTALIYGAFTVALDMGFEAYRYVDRYVINWYLDSARVGTFSAAYTLSTIPLMLGSVVNEVLLPHLSRIFDDGDSKRAQAYVNMFAKAMLIAGILTIGAAAIVREPIIRLLYGEEYAGASTVFPILTAYHVVFATYNTIFLYFFLLKKPQMGMITTAFGLATSLVLNILFIPRWGIAGAAWATFASGCLIFVLALVLAVLFGFSPDVRLLVCFACVPLVSLRFGAYIFIPLALLLWFLPAGMRASERGEIARIIRGGGL